MKNGGGIGRAAVVAAAGVALAGLCAAPARAEPPPAGAGSPTAPPPMSPTAPATPPGSPSRTPAAAAPPPAAPAPVTAEAGAGAAPPPASGPPRVVPVADAAPAPSDHDAVVAAGAWGVEVRRIVAAEPVLALRPLTGCTPMPVVAGAPACPSVEMGALTVRHWLGPNLAVTGGLALAVGGGRSMSRLLDTHAGGGPVLGLSVLLASWRHLAIAASPDLTVVLFRAAGSADTAYLGVLRADLEAELSFGFVGVPALAVGIRSGMAVTLEHADTASVWSVGISGATTVRSLLDQLLLRYYF